MKELKIRFESEIVEKDKLVRDLKKQLSTSVEKVEELSKIVALKHQQLASQRVGNHTRSVEEHQSHEAANFYNNILFQRDHSSGQVSNEKRSQDSALSSTIDEKKRMRQA